MKQVKYTPMDKVAIYGTLVIFCLLILASIFWRSDFEGHPKILVGLFYAVTYGGAGLTVYRIYVNFKRAKKARQND